MTKDPRWKQEPKDDKRAKFIGDPESTDKQTIAWQFHQCDKEHPSWGWNCLNAQELRDLIDRHLSHLETMTWHELAKASGGKRLGNNHHLIEVDKCCRAAKDRLIELKMDDVDQLFSLRLTAKWRLFGVKDGRVLRFVWCDQDHSVYQVRKK